MNCILHDPCIVQFSEYYLVCSVYLLRPFVIYPIELVLVLTLFCFCKVYYSQILLYLCPFQQIYAYYKFTIAISINSLCFRNLTNMISILSLYYEGWQRQCTRRSIGRNLTSSTSSKSGQLISSLISILLQSNILLLQSEMEFANFYLLLTAKRS